MVAGVATGLAQVVQLNPVAGLHWYVVAPDADSVAGVPEQRVTVGLTAKVTAGLMVTVTWSVSLQPEALLPMTV